MTPRQEQVASLRDQGFTQREIAESLNISRRTVRSHLERVSKSSQDPAVEEAKKAFGIDGEVDTVWFKNKEFSVQWRNKKFTGEDIIERAKERFQQIPPAPMINLRVPETDPDLLITYDIFDAHIGMRAHQEVSGQEVDLDSAVARLTNGLKGLYEKTPHSSRGIIINGGDLTHQTDDLNRTRGHGHILDVACRNVFAVEAAIEVLSHGLEMGLQKHDVMEYHYVPGNHDPQNCETVAIGLRERYRDNPRVKINYHHQAFSAIEHGRVGIVLHHGDKRKPKDLVMLATHRYSEMFARTRYRVLKTGHCHHLKADEFPGWYWEQAPAATPPDAYAANGFDSFPMLKAKKYSLNGPRGEEIEVFDE